MDSVEIAAKLVRNRFDELCKTIECWTKRNMLFTKNDIQSESEFVWMLLQDIKQELMMIVQRMPIDSEIHSINTNTKEMDTRLTGFEIALREEYDKAREQYKDIIKSSIELQRIFRDITSVTIPDCKVLKSDYMSKNYPNIVKYAEIVNKYNGSPLKQGNDIEASTDRFTEAIQSISKPVESNAEYTDDSISLLEESTEETKFDENEPKPVKPKFGTKIMQAKLKKEEEKREREKRIEKAKKSFKYLSTNIQIVATCECLIELMQSIQNAINAVKRTVAEQEAVSRDLFNNSGSRSILEITDILKQVKYEIFTDVDGQNRFRLRHCTSGEIVMVSKSFQSIPECLKGIEHLSGLVFGNYS